MRQGSSGNWLAHLRPVLRGLVCLPLLLALASPGHAAKSSACRWHGGHRIEYEQLQTRTGLRVLLVNDPALDRAELTVHVPYGSYDEGQALPGLAHLREHLVAFDPAATQDQALVPWVLKQYQGDHWFKTRDRDTLYFAAVEVRQAPALWRRMRAALAPRDYSLDGVQQQIRVIDGEWQRFRGQDGQILEQLEAQAADSGHPVSRFRSGNLQSLPLDDAEAIAKTASALSRRQHAEGQMSVVLMAPAPLQTQRAWLDLGPSALGRLRWPTPAGSGETAAPPQPSGPVWSKAAAGRLLGSSGGAGDAVLWWMWAPALGAHADRLQLLAEHLAAEEPGSLATTLKDAGLVMQVDAEARPGHYGERDRLFLSLVLTEAGRRQLPALKEQLWGAVAAWAAGKEPWHATRAVLQQRRQQAKAQQLPGQRAIAGFELAHALAHCAGDRVFSACERHEGPWPSAALSAAMNWQDTVAWLVPATAADRRAWAAVLREGRDPGWSDWPVVQASGAVPTPASARPAPVPMQRPQAVQTCRVPADPVQPWEGLAGAVVELQGLSPAAVAALLQRAEHAVQHLAPLRRYAAQERTRPEWALQGSTLLLTLTGRREGQAAALGAWLSALTPPPAAGCCDAAGATSAVIKRLASWPGGQTYDHLMLALRQAVGGPTLDPRAALAELEQGSEQSSVLALEASRLRLFLTEAPGAPGEPCAASAVPPAPALPPAGLRRVSVPRQLEHSALLQRCEAAGFDRFWQLRAWRSTLQRAMRRTAEEGADGLTFVSAPAFVVGSRQCWGISADSRTLQGEALAQAAESRLQASLRLLAQERASDPRWRGGAAPAAACSLAGAWQWWREGQVLPADWRERCVRALGAPESAWMLDPAFAPAGDPAWSRWVDLGP